MDRIKVLQANAIKAAWNGAPESKAKAAMLSHANKIMESAKR